MEEENKVVNSVEQDYIDKLTEMKANSVSRDEYDKLRADNKKLLDAMFNGAQPVVENKPEVEKVDIQALRDELYGGKYDGTDLDYATKVLKLRKAIMDTGAPDPAVSTGAKTEATQADYDYCDFVCNQIQECIDYAQGDPALFRAELMRRTNKR